MPLVVLLLLVGVVGFLAGLVAARKLSKWRAKRKG
jgi:ABC-type antimicrobial peptide transport system permease subunit